MKKSILLSLFAMLSCKKDPIPTHAHQSAKTTMDSSIIKDKTPALKPAPATEPSATKSHFELSKKHPVNTLTLDMDGDAKRDTVKILRNTLNGKSGFQILFGNGKKDELGFGNEILGQGIDELDWGTIFQVYKKGQTAYNNVNEEGEIITDDQVDPKDIITLKNDAIFIHAEESCGGGIIYYQNGKYHWIQQE